MIPILLIIGQIGPFLTKRFLRENKKIQLFASILSWTGLGIWILYHGWQDLLRANLWSVFLTLALSYGLYILSLWIVGTRFSAENLFPKGSFRLTGKLKHSFVSESLRNPVSSAYEELLYRWFLQNALYELTHSAILAVTGTFLLFFAAHLNRRIAIVQIIDIFVFSLAITVFYQWSGSLLCCVWIHIMRNQLIICQKYNQKNNELCKRKTSASHAGRRREKHVARTSVSFRSVVHHDAAVHGNRVSGISFGVGAVDRGHERLFYHCA